MRTTKKRSSKRTSRKRTRPEAQAAFPKSVTFIPEPKLQFGNGQTLESPGLGLSVFGPYDLNGSSQPKSIRWGLLATPDGKQKFLAWVKSLQSGIAPGQNRRKKELNERLWPVFPGFEAAFGCAFPVDPIWSHELDAAELVKICSNQDSKQRAYNAVEAYLSAIEITEIKDEQFDVLICVVPDLIKSVCRPQGNVVGQATGIKITKKEQTLRASGQTDLFGTYDPEIYNYSEDFRRQIKARSLKHGIPIQIVKESTITEPGPDERRKTSPPSDLAWNLSTSIYYKAGGKPWKLAAARPGVCYVGIAFKQTDASADSRTACCAAQMFLDSGDGVVFLGDVGLWYSIKKREFHLSREAAKKLLAGILDCYKLLDGQPLTEVFLHCRSGIRDDEFEGYKEACPDGVKLVAVRVKKEFRGGLKLFREGSYPVVRGTFWKISEKTGFLWASGFIPKLRSYPGHESPVPLRLDIQHGTANIETVAADILALTKLNYNACKFGDSEPVTVGFSDRVGEILVSNPTVKERQFRFKFYI